ncbi:MAG TPA: hypothetical protein VH413_12255 [Verrucomicrobiae bacterium]|nr:hypothetical protein [Verrucomicrobiae bacterium]
MDRRTAWLRVVLLGATLSGLLTSIPLWLNARMFPLIPIVPGFPTLPAPLDTIFFLLMLASLLAAFWFYRPAIKCFLLLGLFAFCEDQNRGQPWFYLYYILLGLTLLPPPSAIAAARLAISAMYIWSGLQKLNARFFAVEPAWFISPATHWHLPGFVLGFMRSVVWCAPFIEIGIATAVWSKQIWRVAIAVVILIHLGSVLLLGPLGYNYNWVVLPWNFAMIGLVGVLFWRGKPFELVKAEPQSSGQINFVQAFNDLRRSPIGFGVIIAFAILPALSFVGLWDSYFSFALYSENSATANIFVSKAFADRLPPKLAGDVIPYGKFDPQYQGPYIFRYAVWGYQELHVPPISEPRAFHAVFKYLRKYSEAPGDLRMITGDRRGDVIFYEGDFHQLLKAK